MTKEEILATVTMGEVLSNRGIRPNRSGMCSCPFHGKDSHPSMKIFKDGFKCYACNESGNVIDFVMKYENISFKQAFILLGGTYEFMNERERKLAESARNRNRSEKERIENAEKSFKKELSYIIALTRKACSTFEPTSDEWCWFENKLPVLLNAWYLKYEIEEEIDEINVLRICREVRQKINSICRVI